MTAREMAQQIFDWEARRDSNGHLRVYLLPASDGGGKFEVAGINEKYDREMANKLKELIEAKRYSEAEIAAIAYIENQTNVVHSWSSLPAAEFFLRSTMFNRGEGGAAKILQMALGITQDGSIGPITRSAVAVAQRRPLVFLFNLRAARERYEQAKVGYRPEFANGLRNRWDNEFEASAELIA